MRPFFQKHQDFCYMGLFPLLHFFYFLLQKLPLQYHIVHTTMDEYIPFLPVFILPYIFWYIYVPLPMLYMYFTRRQIYLRQIVTLFSGAFICVFLFFLCPTAINFRPQPQGRGLLLSLCRMIFQSDQPVNVFPSLHCYEAMAIHLSTFSGSFGREHLLLRLSSAVAVTLICLSTVFVKQHSVADLIAGCFLSILIHVIINRFFQRKEAPHVNSSL